MTDWPRLIRDIRDFPRPGVLFKDIMPMLADADAFAAVIDALAAPWRDVPIDAVMAIESRGFLFGAPLARALGTGLVPLRK
ncbi:MAG: adenine phosphoribosyltransferase, partial [Xanthomonadaceae bacterium]|nr:adenine phosphoribosyltransferase [Xanthomonadaceae bacterium]